MVPVYSDSGICDELGEEFASPTKQYIYACQREQVGRWNEVGYEDTVIGATAMMGWGGWGSVNV